MKTKHMEFLVQKVQHKAQAKASEMLKKLSIDDGTAEQQPGPPANLPYSPPTYYEQPPPNATNNMPYPPSPYNAAPNASALHPHFTQQNADPSASATHVRPPSHLAGPPPGTPGTPYGLYYSPSSQEQPPQGDSLYPQPSHYESQPPPSPSPYPSHHPSVTATDPPSAPYATAHPTRLTPKLNKLPPAAYHSPPHTKASSTTVSEEYASPRPHHSPHPQHPLPYSPSPNPAPNKPSTSHNSASGSCNPWPSQEHYPQPTSDQLPNVYYPQPPSHQPTTVIPPKDAKRPAPQKVTHRPTSAAPDKPDGYPSAPAYPRPPGYGAPHQQGSQSYACSAHDSASHSPSAHPHHHHYHHHQHVEVTSDVFICSQCHSAENPVNQASAPPESPSSYVSQNCHVSGVNVIPVQVERPSEPPELLMEELLDAAFERQGSALNILGSTLLDEARKGLSRVIDPGDDADIQLFSVQLRRMDFSACESDFKRGGRDGIPCFALSYTRKDRMVGRFPFEKLQWDNFRRAMNLLASSGIRQVRVWLDQCLWLRDANLVCWAHTGIVPYVIWPVVSLGLQIDTADRTIDSYERVWPFVEEVAGLLSMGVLTFCEMSQGGEALEHIVQYNQRVCLELEVSILAIFHIICEGALNELECSCPEDVMELVDMAQFNMENECQDVIIGGNWRSRIAPVQRCPQSRPFRSSAKSKYLASYSAGKVPLNLVGSDIKDHLIPKFS